MTAPAGDGPSGAATVEVRLLRAEEAPQLVRCIERCYGDTYVAESFYDADRLGGLVAAGLLRSVVAVSPVDGIVGHMGLTIRHPAARTVDAGNTVVDPRYRGHSLAARMAARLVTLCREGGFVGFHHYPTTAHPIMQKLAVAGGGVETGVMLGYIPAGTNYRGLAQGASPLRLAVVIVYQPIAAAPAASVFPPVRYRTVIASAYDAARLERSLGTAASSPVRAATEVEASSDARRGLLRLTVASAGRDLAARVEALTREHTAELVQVDLALGDPGVECASETLRTQGFFLAGVLPEYLQGDVLRLQRLADAAPEVLLPELATDGGSGLLDSITADRLALPARSSG